MKAVEKYQLDVYGFRPFWDIWGIGMLVCPEAWPKNPQNKSVQSLSSESESK